ncbi:MAG: pentapeptide repeat-containing protein [Tildeniella torsiva UHER 1998/13D]|jgi:uncharacterized protein YjbI with pentapeptide repeats|nr:pentapeptide repeat-containing protein [Tildeniella torsiva UHER 1998/13D]
MKRIGLYVPGFDQKREIHPVVKPFHWAEQRMEGLLGWLKELAFLEILGIVSNIGLLIAVATYIGSEKQRRDAEVLNAWQTITSAYGQSGSGGRIQALEFLNASPGAKWRRKFPWLCGASHPLCTWNSESLAGINLSVSDGEGDGTYLSAIQLPKAILEDANLKGANLEFANLEGADLTRSNLEGAFIFVANLKGAYLSRSNLEGAELTGSDLEGAGLSGANLKRSSLAGTNLEGTFLQGASLRETNLSSANLEGANLEGADLEGANLLRTNLVGAKNLTKEQLIVAKFCRTMLPAAITGLDPSRDCSEIDIRPLPGLGKPK